MNALPVRLELLERRLVDSRTGLIALGPAAFGWAVGGAVGLLAAFIAGTILFVLTLHDLSIGTIALVATVPLQTEFALHAGGREITATKFVVVVVGAAWIVRCLSGASNPPVDSIGLMLGLYIVVLALSAVEARDLNAWAEEVYRWAVALFAYLVARESLSTPESRRRFLLMLSALMCVMSAVAIWQVATHAGPPTFTVDGVTRAFGSFGEPNPFAAFFEFSVPLLLAVALNSLSSRQLSVVTICGAIAGSAGLALTQSRGGYLGLAAAVAIVIWLSGGKVRKVGTVVGLICLAAIIISPFGGRIRDGLQLSMLDGAPVQITTDNFAAQERSAHWGAAIRMAEKSPLLGAGAGNFNARFRDSTPNWRFRIARGHAHNNYLQVLAQSGLLGIVAYLGVLAAVSRLTLRKLKRCSQPEMKPFAIGAAGVTAALLVHGLFDYLHVLSLGILLSAVWGCLASLPGPDDVPVTAG